MVRLYLQLGPDEFDVTVASVVEISDDVVDILPEYVSIHQLDISDLVKPTDFTTTRGRTF